MSIFDRFFKGKASSAPRTSAAPHPEIATSHHPCRMQPAGCAAPATWRNRAGHYFCDEHKEVMDVMLRLNHHDPGWQRL